MKNRFDHNGRVTILVKWGFNKAMYGKGVLNICTIKDISAVASKEKTEVPSLVVHENFVHLRECGTLSGLRLTQWLQFFKDRAPVGSFPQSSTPARHGIFQLKR